MWVEPGELLVAVMGEANQGELRVFIGSNVCLLS
jgi:hypothetical protein